MDKLEPNEWEILKKILCPVNGKCELKSRRTTCEPIEPRTVPTCGEGKGHNYEMEDCVICSYITYKQREIDKSDLCLLSAHEPGSRDLGEVEIAR